MRLFLKPFPPSDSYLISVGSCVAADCMRSISGTSSGKEKAVVASLSCSPDGRCSNINVNGITVTYVSVPFLFFQVGLHLDTFMATDHRRSTARPHSRARTPS